MTQATGTKRTFSRRRVLSWALVSRLSTIVLMVISDELIPDHDPGDGVVAIPDWSVDCSCFKGHICDPIPRSYDSSCADEEMARKWLNEEPSLWYSSLLSPLSKWDAARILSLAVHPAQRRPRSCAVHLQETCSLTVSEQSHAFLPLVPHVFGRTALALDQCVPRRFLPPTFLGTTMLAALLVNLVAFLVATIALHDLTLSKTGGDIHLAETTCLLFCINPAGVFFSTAYSEAVFSALMFVGYAQAARGNYHVAMVPWMLASYTRSNGSMTAVWLILQGVAASAASCHEKRSLRKQVCVSLLYFALAILVLLPIMYNDRHGRELHCNSEGSTKPEWCDDERIHSFYAYIQRKHWNVGFLHYYKLKQIPNFLLATPILCYGTAGVISWIKASWYALVHTSQPSLSLISLVQWVWDALARSVDTGSTTASSTSMSLLLSPQMLADYAILAVTCILGLTVAHVQISTRLICSSCPAIYWFLAHLYTRDQTVVHWLSSRQTVLAYCIIYNILGIIMHVNWLPWT